MWVICRQPRWLRELDKIEQSTCTQRRPFPKRKSPREFKWKMRLVRFRHTLEDHGFADFGSFIFEINTTLELGNPYGTVILKNSAMSAKLHLILWKLKRNRSDNKYSPKLALREVPFRTCLDTETGKIKYLDTEDSFSEILSGKRD